MPFTIDVGALAVGAVLGLLIGSFLNVVIYRLPKMMDRQWVAECQAMAQAHPELPMPAPAPASGEERFNLLVPRSRCSHCGHQIRWYENIPVLSFVVLRGRCAACAAPIGWRYPLVELVTGVLGAYCAHRWGLGWQALAWFGFAACLWALAWIDWDTTLLPDDMTLPLVWAGLLAAQARWSGVTLPDALWGAVAGYLSLWLVYWAFKLLTGKEGMGHGDFKLLAALGAWFGWQGLIPMILMASVIGAVIGLLLKFQAALRDGVYLPFGPFLAGAGLTAMVVGPQTILTAIGL